MWTPQIPIHYFSIIFYWVKLTYTISEKNPLKPKIRTFEVFKSVFCKKTKTYIFKPHFNSPEKKTHFNIFGTNHYNYDGVVSHRNDDFVDCADYAAVSAWLSRFENAPSFSGPACSSLATGWANGNWLMGSEANAGFVAGTWHRAIGGVNPLGSARERSQWVVSASCGCVVGPTPVTAADHAWNQWIAVLTAARPAMLLTPGLKDATNRVLTAEFIIRPSNVDSWPYIIQRFKLHSSGRSRAAWVDWNLPFDIDHQSCIDWLTEKVTRMAKAHGNDYTRWESSIHRKNGNNM